MSKNLKEALEGRGNLSNVSILEGVKILKKIAFAKFDETVELHIRINHKNLQDVRGFVDLPNGTGKDVRVLVFADGDQAEDARSAGADYVGGEDLIDKISSGWFDFDAVVATPGMMKNVGKLGPVLGRKGLMPKPKAGTVTTKVAPIIKSLKSGRIEYKPDKTGVIHFIVGKISFSEEKTVENIVSVISTVFKKRPVEAKGEYLASIHLAATQSPSVCLSVKESKSLVA